MTTCLVCGEKFERPSEAIVHVGTHTARERAETERRLSQR